MVYAGAAGRCNPPAGQAGRATQRGPDPRNARPGKAGRGTWQIAADVRIARRDPFGSSRSAGLAQGDNARPGKAGRGTDEGGNARPGKAGRGTWQAADVRIARRDPFGSSRSAGLAQGDNGARRASPAANYAPARRGLSERRDAGEVGLQAPVQLAVLGVQGVVAVDVFAGGFGGFDGFDGGVARLGDGLETVQTGFL